MDNSDNSRRKFIQDSVKLLGAIGINHALANSIVQAIGETAFAQTANLSSEKKYVYLSLDGAPPRWFFDLPLTPNGSSDHYPTSNSIGTYITKSGNEVLLQNKPWQDPSSKLWLPPVWGSNPKSSTGEFQNLKNSLYFFRGVDMEIDNHEVTRLRNQAPTIGGISIAGVYAARTNTPIPAVVSGAVGSSFKADTLVTPVNVGHGGVTNTNNSIVTAMAYVSGNKPLNDGIVKQQLKHFDDYAKQQGIVDYGIKAAKERADAMILEGVSKFTNLWSGVYAKYDGLVKAAMTDSKNKDKFIINQNIANPVLKNPSDLRMSMNQIGSSFIPSTVTNIQDSVTERTTISQLASTFAALEILLLNNITSICCFSLTGSSLSNMSISPTATAGLTSDQHFTGQLLSTYGTSHFYRGIITCMDELARVLKANGMFKNTLIQFGSEFGRSPRANGSGADHATLAGSALLVSGGFSETRVVGNITSIRTGGYAGFTGTGLPTKHTNNERMRVNDVVKTVCHFLDVRAVTENGYSLLNLTGKETEKKNVA